MAERKSRPRSNRKHSQVELGGLLAHLRVAKGRSLRQVEDLTDSAVSNAYLSALEKGRIQKPSPHVLHSLAAVYAAPYETLMEKAGYLLPSEDKGGRRRRLAAFAIDDLTAEEGGRASEVPGVPSLPHHVLKTATAARSDGDE